MKELFTEGRVGSREHQPELVTYPGTRNNREPVTPPAAETAVRLLQEARKNCGCT